MIPETPRSTASTVNRDVLRPLWPGSQGPAAGTPPRLPGSARRTTSVDMLRRDGPLRLVGRGRDLVTGSDGTARVTDTAGMDVVIDLAAGNLVTAARAEPEVPAVADLAGRSALSKFRPAVRAAFGEDLAGTALAQLFDDIPVAVIVSFAALARANAQGRAQSAGTARDDVCAGWRSDGALARRRREHGPGSLLNEFGPVAGDLLAGDPLGWHPMPPLEPGAVRRLRRLDIAPRSAVTGSLWPPASGGEATLTVPDGAAHLVDATVRDTFQDPQDTEIVIHEFVLRAALGADGTVLAAAAGIGVVPGPQCPLAGPSAARVVGRPVGALRDTVAREFVGITTCTHLNDTMRTLGDVPRLVALLAA